MSRLLDVEAMEAEVEAPVRRRLLPLMPAVAAAAARLCFERCVRCWDEARQRWRCVRRWDEAR
jgi:hypothetical protein